MADSYMVDVNNREQIKEFLVYVSTSPDGVKMGARAVALTGSNPTDAKAPGNGDVVALLEGFNGISWDKLRTLQDVLTNAGAQGVLATAPIVYDPFNGNYKRLQAAAADGLTSNSTLAAGMVGFNNATFDRWRNNTEAVPLASLARTVSSVSPDFTVYNGGRLAVFLDVTAFAGTAPTLDVTVKVKDPASGKYFLVGAFTQAAGVANQALFIGHGADTKFATRTYRIECVIGGTAAPSFTFSVGTGISVG